MAVRKPLQDSESPARKPRLAVVSPFLDKSHGSERIVIEWLTHLPGEFEIHIYSQRVQDLGPLNFTWHRIPRLPGPHLFDFIWWFAANHIWRKFDGRFRDLEYDLVFSPGANCLDADVISVHILFSEYVRENARKIALRTESRMGLAASLASQAVLLPCRVFGTPGLSGSSDYVDRRFPSCGRVARDTSAGAWASASFTPGLIAKHSVPKSVWRSAILLARSLKFPQITLPYF